MLAANPAAAAILTLPVACGDHAALGAATFALMQGGCGGAQWRVMGQVHAQRYNCSALHTRLPGSMFL